jgi:hypothetical protein
VWRPAVGEDILFAQSAKASTGKGIREAAAPPTGERRRLPAADFWYVVQASDKLTDGGIVNAVLLSIPLSVTK